MKMASSVSPDALKLVILLAGLVGAFSIGNMVSKRIENMRYEPILGEKVGQGATNQISANLEALPIVIASANSQSGGAGDLSSELIEEAFRPPIFEQPAVIEEPEPEEPTYSMTDIFMYSYRPAVHAISENGAVINGVFWRTGTELETMKMRYGDEGVLVVPRLVAVNANSVDIRIMDELVRLDFDRP